MKKYFYLISIISALSVLMVFFLDFGTLAYRIVNNLVNIPPRNYSKIQVIGGLMYLGLGISFYIGGYYCVNSMSAF